MYLVRYVDFFGVLVHTYFRLIKCCYFFFLTVHKTIVKSFLQLMMLILEVVYQSIIYFAIFSLANLFIPWYNLFHSFHLFKSELNGHPNEGLLPLPGFLQNQKFQNKNILVMISFRLMLLIFLLWDAVSQTEILVLCIWSYMK